MSCRREPREVMVDASGRPSGARDLDPDVVVPFHRIYYEYIITYNRDIVCTVPYIWRTVSLCQICSVTHITHVVFPYVEHRSAIQNDRGTLTLLRVLVGGYLSSGPIGVLPIHDEVVNIHPPTRCTTRVSSISRYSGTLFGPPEIKVTLVDFSPGKGYGQIVAADQKLVDLLDNAQRAELAQMRQVMLKHPHEIERERPAPDAAIPA